MTANLAPATRPERATHKTHGRPAGGFYFGYGREPIGVGRLVTLAPVFRSTSARVQVLDVATGETVAELVAGQPFWLAPAAEVTTEQIAAAAVDVAHAEAALYDEWRRLTSGRREPSAELVRVTLECEQYRAARRGLGALTLAFAARIAELDAPEAPAGPAEVVIVPCGGAKLDRPAPAGELYTGSYHRAARRAADALGGRVFILSALHGLLTLDQEVAPYDLRMGQRGSVTPDQVRGQAAALDILDARVTVLAGKAYADVVSAVWPEARRPLDGTRGMFEQIGWLAAIARGERPAALTAPTPPAHARPAVVEQLALFVA